MGQPEAKQRVRTKIGDRFGLLTVENFIETDHRGMRVRCRCDCGEEYYGYAADLRKAVKKGRTPSCGCKGVATPKPVPQPKVRIPAIKALCANCIEERMCWPCKHPRTGRQIMLCHDCASGQVWIDMMQDGHGEETPLNW